MPAHVFQPHVFALEDSAAVAHLFRVAAGLDSLVVGEPQILGQVKDAFQSAADQHCVGPVLSTLFRWSFGVGKRVRTETALGEGAVSVSFAAVVACTQDLRQSPGAPAFWWSARARSARSPPSTCEARAWAPSSSRAGRPLTPRRSRPKRVGVAVPWEGMLHELSSADIVVTATGSPRPIITRAQLEAAQAHRRGSPLFIIDIAVPRDVEASVGDIEQVFLYNIDDLQAIVQENLSRRAAESRARGSDRQRGGRALHGVAPIAGRGADGRCASPAVRDDPASRNCSASTESSVALTPDARARVDEVTRLIVEKLLVEPTEQLKALPDEETEARLHRGA